MEEHSNDEGKKKNPALVERVRTEQKMDNRKKKRKKKSAAKKILMAPEPIPPEIQAMRERWKQFRRKLLREQQEAIEMQIRASSILDENSILSTEIGEEIGYEMATMDDLLHEQKTLMQDLWDKVAGLDYGLFGKDPDRTDRYAPEDTAVFNYPEGTYETILNEIEEARDRKEEDDDYERPLREWWDYMLQSRAREQKKLSGIKGDKKRSGDSDICTVSSCDETSICSSAISFSDSSCSSYQSWMSWMTEKFTNKKANRFDAADDLDDPWSAAKRGDLGSLQRWKQRGHDWTQEDQFGNPPLYYACQSGGAHDIRVVLFLLQNWPALKKIPPNLMERCKMNAINIYVRRMLFHPHLAERIIQEVDDLSSDSDENDDDVLTLDLSTLESIANGYWKRVPQDTVHVGE